MRSKRELTTYYASFAVFLFAALALAVPSGYTYGAVLLFFAGLVVMWEKATWQMLGRDEWLIVFALVFFGLVWCLEVILDQQGMRGFDKPLRFFAAALALPFLVRFPPQPGYFWGGLAVGGCVAGLWAGWEKYFLGSERASGYRNAIQFGNVSLLFGLQCLAGLGWAAYSSRRWLWVGILFLGFIGGLLGSLFSGTRGGWLILAIAPFLYCFLPARIRWTYLGAGVIAFILLITLVSLLPQSEVRERIDLAISEVRDYFVEDRVESSIGIRFELWRNAWNMAGEKPFLGWGKNGYLNRTAELVADGEAHGVIKRFRHVHNEYLDRLVKQGVLGMMALLILYLLPLVLFAANLRHHSISVRTYAVAGILLTIFYIFSSLTQAVLLYNSSVMIYNVLLIIIWSGCRRALTVSSL